MKENKLTTRVRVRAIEQPVRRQTRARRAHFDARETDLSCRAVWMLLNRALSWRHGGRPRSVDPPQYLSEQGLGDGALCQLKGDIAAMSYDLRADLDELVAECRQRPVLDLLRQYRLPLMAKKRSSSHVRGTSAYPPTGDIRWPMSVIVLISSALPLKAGVAAVGHESP